jgi:uncharacterized LabA/DUF88 family protein
MKNGKTIIFIDGSNFHYALRKVGYLEKDINWSRLFEHIVQQADPDTSFWRAHWYVVGELSEFIIYLGQLHARCPRGTTVEQFRKDCEEWYAGEESRLRKKHQEVYGRIAEEFDRVDFRPVGVLKVNPVTREIMGEKGVDIALALDLADSTADFDTAVVVSGDFDFHPAFQKAKDQLKNVVVAPFVIGDPEKFDAGQARGLRRLADKVVPIHEKILNDPQREFLKNVQVYRPCLKVDGRWLDLNAEVRQEGDSKWVARVIKIDSAWAREAHKALIGKESSGKDRHGAVMGLKGILSSELRSRRR